jgi:hypothetical protein
LKEVTKSVVPLSLAFCGMVIAIVAMLSPTLTGEQRATFAGVAGAGLTGAAGLARSPRESTTNVDEAQEVNIDAK